MSVEWSQRALEDQGVVGAASQLHELIFEFVFYSPKLSWGIQGVRPPSRELCISTQARLRVHELPAPVFKSDLFSIRIEESF
jgi:hypothetical protein